MTLSLRKLVRAFGGSSQPTIPWGHWKLPFKAREDNFLVMGTAGSGKTLSFIDHYATILPTITPGSNNRAFIYDVKGDTIPILGALKKKGLLHPKTPIILFNPEDSRSFAWDVAADINIYPQNQLDTPIQRFVQNLFPPPKHKTGSDTFFNTRTVALGSALIHGFLQANINWSLSDLLETLRSEDRYTKLVSQTQFGQATLQSLGSEETKENVTASMDSYLLPIAAMARLMQLASDQQRTFTVHEWLKSSSILVITGPNKPEDPLAALNRTLMVELNEQLLNLPETTTSTTWFYLDEVTTMGSLPMLPALVTKGRSKGASVMLGFQDISGIYAALGNQEEAKSVLAQIKNTAFLMAPDIDSARYASERCGEVRRIGPDKILRDQPRFNPTYFQDLDKFRKGVGLPAVYRTAGKPPQKVITKPLLLDLEATDLEAPLGQLHWPEDLYPNPNEALEEFYKTGSSSTKKTPLDGPSTGRIYGNDDT